MKIFITIFEVQCKGSLTDPETLIHISQRYPIFGHPRAFKGALAYGVGQNPLKCLKDGRIFIFTSSFLNSIRNHVSCAVVWVEQQVAILNHIQKQSGKHANVSNYSAGSKATTFNQRPSWVINLIDTICQQNTLKCLWDVEENECLHQLKGFKLKLGSPLMKGYKEGYAY